MSSVSGFVAPGFEPVRDAFAQNFAERGEVGASVCAVLRGVCVVDLWGGLADPASSAPWQRDTLALVFSATKGVTAACVHVLAERGVLDLDAPIAEVWPEFAAGGKADVPLRMALTHQIGLPVVEGDFTLEQVCAVEPVVAQLARQTPLWKPGSQHGYHARSYGWILGEVVRRVTGTTLGRWLAREVAAPLSLDFHVGLPESEEPRVARLLPAAEPADPRALALRDRFMGPDTLLGRVLSGPADLRYDERWNGRALHATEMPSSNGIGNARSLARLYAALVGELDGIRLLSASALARACAVQVDGPDAVLPVPTRFGLGFLRPPALGESCPAPAFGHPGAGGSLGFGDPEAGLGFGYAMNQMQLGLSGDPRSASLVAALYACLPSGRSGTG